MLYLIAHLFSNGQSKNSNFYPLPELRETQFKKTRGPLGARMTSRKERQRKINIFEFVNVIFSLESTIAWFKKKLNQVSFVPTAIFIVRGREIPQESTNLTRDV